VKGFDPKAEALPDHPLWKRFKAVTGDTPASRDIFARIINNRRWLQRLDDVERNPASAAKAYREECIEIGRQALNPAIRESYAYWDRIDGAAFLLFLGSYPGTTQPNPARPNHDDECFSAGEAQLVGDSALVNGIRGHQPEPYVPTPDFPPPPKWKPLVPGFDRVLAKLVIEWFPKRTHPDVLSHGFSDFYCSEEASRGLLPFARKIAADKSVTAHIRCLALFVVVQARNPTDLPLFEAFFEDKETFQEYKGPPRPANVRPDRATLAQNRDVAIALALFLYDQYPVDFGFEMANDPWRRKDEKPVLGHYAPLLFGFPNDESRAAAHKKAKDFLRQRKSDAVPVSPAPRPKR
jgi:hypothetical protein